MAGTTKYSKSGPRSVQLHPVVMLLLIGIFTISCNLISLPFTSGTQGKSSSNIQNNEFERVPDAREAMTQGNADKIKQLGIWGKGKIESLAWSADSKVLGVGGSAGIHMYNSKNLEEIRFIQTDGWVNSLVLSPKENLVAFGQMDGSVWLWYETEQKLVQVIQGQGNQLPDVAFSPDGQFIGVTANGSIMLIKVDTLNILKTFEGQSSSGSELAFSPDGSVLAVVLRNEIRLFGVADGQVFHSYQSEANSIIGFKFSPDGKLLAIHTDDKRIVFWAINDGTRTDQFMSGELLSNTDDVIAFNPKKDIFVYPDNEDFSGQTISFRRLSEGGAIGAIKVTSGYVFKLAFSPDGETLATANFDVSFGNKVELWRTSNQSFIKSTGGYKSELNDLILSNNGDTLLVAYLYEGYYLLQFPDGKSISGKSDEWKSSMTVAFSPSGNYFAYTTINPSFKYDDIVVVSFPGWKQLWRMEAQDFSPRGLIFSSNGKIVVVESTTSDGQRTTLRVLQSSTGQSISAIEYQSAGDIEVSPNGEFIAVDVGDKIQVWKTSSGEQYSVFEDNAVEDMVFSPDSNFLLTSFGSSLKFWDVASGGLIRAIDDGDQYKSIYSVDYSPTGDMVAAGTYNGLIEIWRSSDGILLKKLTGHTGLVNAVRFSSDGQYLVSGSADGTIRFWGIAP